MNKKIESLYQDYKELRYLDKTHDEAMSEFKHLDIETYKELKRYIIEKQFIKAIKNLEDKLLK